MKSLVPPLQLLQQHKEGVHLCKRQWMLELCHLYCKMLSLLICKLWQNAPGREGAWSPSTVVLFRSWFLARTANVYWFTYRHLIEGLAGTKEWVWRSDVQPVLQLCIILKKLYLVICTCFPVILLLASLSGKRTFLLFAWEKLVRCTLQSCHGFVAPEIIWLGKWGEWKNSCRQHIQIFLHWWNEWDWNSRKCYTWTASLPCKPQRKALEGPEQVPWWRIAIPPAMMYFYSWSKAMTLNLAS